MKKVKKIVSTAIIGASIFLAMPLTANAALLELWANAGYRGTKITSTSCTFDFADNINDSGK